MSARMLGIDPGGKYTGVIVRAGDEVLGVRVVTRSGSGDLPDTRYIHEVLDEITSHVELVDGIAVEGLVVPKGRDPGGNETHMNVAGLIGVGMVFGAVLARWPRAVVVPPGGHGSLPEVAYPLVIRKRAKNLGGPSSHARSAYDVAGVGRLLMRTQRQQAGGR